MVTSSFIKIFSIVVLAALSVSAQRECPPTQAQDGNTEKKRFIVIFDKQVKNAVQDHYEIMKECYKTSVQSIFKADESASTVFNQSVIKDFSVDGSIQGYTSYFTPEFAKAVGKMKNVKLVEEEKVVKIDKISLAASRRFSRRHSTRNRRAEARIPQMDIDRIDQAKRPLDGKFVFPDSAGSGVNIFIVDSGVQLTHEQFNGRAKFGAFFCDQGEDCGNDLFFHGTYVASIAAGNTIGVARKANIIDVRVLDVNGSGSSATMIQGLSFVIDQHKKGQNKNSVINMSLGLPVSEALNDAVQEVTDAGIHIAVAAGNESEDACELSPASAPSAITAGATEDKSDAVTDFSNFGKCVDIFAPGRNFLGANVGDDNAYVVESGTSCSSPVVAGTLALLIAKSGNKPPAALTKDLIDLSTKGVVTGLKEGSPDAFIRTPAP